MSDNKKAATKDKEKQVKAFFGTAKGAEVDLFFNAPQEGKRIPEVSGKVAGASVALRARKGTTKGNFFGVTKRVKTDQKGEDGKAVYAEQQIGTANLQPTASGPKLAIVMTANKDKTIWATPRKEATNDAAFMEKAGWTAEKQQKVEVLKAEKAKKAAATPDKAPAPKA